MTTLSTAEETILQSDRVPIFLGTNRLFLKKGVQSSNRTVEIPNTDIEEQGNVELRGISIQSPRVSFTLEDLSVDMDMEQYLSSTYATIEANTFTGDANMISFRSNNTSGVVVYPVGATNKINSLVLVFASAAVRLGEGAKFIGSNNTLKYVTLVSAAKNVNFSVGKSVQIQKTASAVTTTIGTVSNVSGARVYFTGLTVLSAVTNSGFIFVSDGTNNITSASFLSGTPIVMKGIEVFAVGNKAVTTTPGAGKATVAQIGLVDTPANGIDTNSWKNSYIDAVMLYNDYNDNLVFSRYVQDAACTSVGFNFTAEGNATQSYDFTTGKSMDYRGYVLRKSIGATTTSAIQPLASMLVTSGEVIDPIANNTTFNGDATLSKKFLKLTTISPAGVKLVWEEVASAPTTTQYTVTGTTITFGASVSKGTRIEATFLCKAANVAVSPYKFSTADFDNTGTPDSVTGKYQPLVINTNDFTNRVDGIESSNFTVTYARDYFDSQGILNTRVRPASRGSLEGSLSTKEGFSKTMNTIVNGIVNTAFVSGVQMDVSKSANYTSTNTVPLAVRLYDPKDNATIVKTITIPAIQVTNMSNANSVGGDSTLSVNFKGKAGKATITR